MKNLPILHSDYLPDFKNHRILLDTNFIIESNRHAENFANLIAIIKNNSKEVFTLEVVKKEFLYGVKIKKDLNDFENFFKQLVSVIDSDTNCFSKHLMTVTKLYRNHNKKISLEDFMIVCYMLEANSTILLTKNHSDFPLKIFNRLGFIIVEYENELQLYAFYQIDEGKVETLIKDFEKTP